MPDEKQSTKTGILVVIILVLIGLVLALASRINQQVQDVPGLESRR